MLTLIHDHVIILLKNEERNKVMNSKSKAKLMLGIFLISGLFSKMNTCLVVHASGRGKGAPPTKIESSQNFLTTLPEKANQELSQNSTTLPTQTTTPLMPIPQMIPALPQMVTDGRLYATPQQQNFMTATVPFPMMPQMATADMGLYTTAQQPNPLIIPMPAPITFPMMPQVAATDMGLCATAQQPNPSTVFIPAPGPLLLIPQMTPTNMGSCATAQQPNPLTFFIPASGPFPMTPQAVKSEDLPAKAQPCKRPNDTQVTQGSDPTFEPYENAPTPKKRKNSTEELPKTAQQLPTMVTLQTPTNKLPDQNPFARPDPSTNPFADQTPNAINRAFVPRKAQNKVAKPTPVAKSSDAVFVPPDPVQRKIQQTKTVSTPPVAPQTGISKLQDPESSRKTPSVAYTQPKNNQELFENFVKILEQKNIAPDEMPLVDVAISKGFHKFVSNSFENTAIHQAILNGNDDMVKKLAPVSNLLSANVNRLTPLHLAIMKGNPEIIKLLMTLAPEAIGKGDMDGQTPLHYAIIYRCTPDILNLLFSINPALVISSLNNTDLEGRTVGHWAAITKVALNECLLPYLNTTIQDTYGNTVADYQTNPAHTMDKQVTSITALGKRAQTYMQYVGIFK